MTPGTTPFNYQEAVTYQEPGSGEAESTHGAGSKRSLKLALIQVHVGDGDSEEADIYLAAAFPSTLSTDPNSLLAPH